MELFIIPLFIWFIKLLINLAKFLFRAVCFILGCIGLGIGNARSRSAQRKQHELKQAEFEWKMQFEQAKQEQREQDRLARIERERTKAEREAIRWEWEVQKEADRRSELEWKRQRREQIERERREMSSNEKQRKIDFEKREAARELEYCYERQNELEDLYSHYEKEYFDASQRREHIDKNKKSMISAQKNMISLAGRQRTLEKRINRAHYILNKAGR